MKCPRCGMNYSKKGYCMYCGYLENGNIIDTKKEIRASTLELYFGKHYDKYIRNKNWLISFFIGPVYILSHGHYLVGIGLILLDFIISIMVLLFNQALLITATIWFLNRVYWFINRLLWATINNMIYIRLTTNKLIKYKEKNPDDFELKVQELYQKDNRFIILKYIIFSIIFYIIFNIIKPIIINYFLSI